MLRTLKDLFASLTTPTETPADAAHALQLSAAVLLVEVMRADPATTPDERAAVVDALRIRFALLPDEIDRLLELAHDEARNAYDTQRFTNELNEQLTHEQKVHMVEAMWQVAFADGHLEAHENHLISKVAGLLHVTHGEYIAAKLHAKAAAQQG